MRLAALALAVAVLASGCGGGASKEGAVEAARDAYAQATDDGRNFASGPCIANPLPEPYDDWVVDIVHEPRQPQDDEAANQCSAYRDGRAGHFVELDEFGHLVTAQ